MAEAVFRSRFGHAGMHMDVQSAGVAASPGQPIHPAVAELLAQRGYWIDAQKRAQSILHPLVGVSDLVLVTETRQKRLLDARFPAAVGKFWLLGQWIETPEIPDPIGKNQAFFEATLDLIEGSVDSWIPTLERIAFDRQPKIRS
jgi:protein-tyrosine phosphatase